VSPLDRPRRSDDSAEASRGRVTSGLNDVSGIEIANITGFSASS
jgi:hypothetical protein